MSRPRLTRRQILELFDRSEGRCWRCGQKIVDQVYGEGWELGHCDKPHWMGGVDVAPEHTACNRADGILQTKAEAKSIRIRARAAGIKKLGRPVPGSRNTPYAVRYDRETGGFRTVRR